MLSTMFHEKDYRSYHGVGKALGFLMALLTFASMAFYVFLRKQHFISYLDLIGSVVLLYLLGILVKMAMRSQKKKQDVVV